MDNRGFFINTSTLTNSRKAKDARGRLSNFFEDLCLAVLGDVMSDLKVSKCSTSLSMYHSLWDSFPVKMTHLIQKLDVLQQDRSPGSSCHGGRLGVNGTPISSSEDIRFLDRKKEKKNLDLISAC